MLLSQVGLEVLGRERKANDLYSLNPTLKLPEVLPADAQLKLPQPDLPAIVGFIGLCILLLVVGIGWILKGPEEEAA